MPDFSMWGPAESGTRLAQQDAMDMMQKLSSVKQSAAHTDMLRVEAEKSRMQLKQLQTQQELMLRAAQQRKEQQNPQNPANISRDDALANQLDDAAQLMMDAGMYEQGTKLLDESSKVRSRTATADHQKALAEHDKMVTLSDRSDLIERNLGGATNNQEWQEGLRRLQKLLPGQMPEDLLNSTYDPKVKDTIRRQAMSMKDAALASYRKDEMDYRDRNEKRLERADSSREHHQEVMEGLTKERIEAQKKAAGAKGVKSASKQDLEFATDLILQSDKSIHKNDVGLKLAASQIANDALSIMAVNPNISKTVAMNKAFAQAKADGRIKQSPKQQYFGLLPDKMETEFKAEGKGSSEAKLPAGVKVEKFDVPGVGKVDSYVAGDGHRYGIVNGRPARLD